MMVGRFVVLLCCALPLGAVAQSRVAGRVVRVAGSDTLPVGKIAVVLHRVGQRAQGPIDTAVAGPGGRFSFRFSADTTAAYLLSARYGGIEYFSSPVATNPTRPDTAVIVIVADTSSTAPVSVRQRTILVSAPDESGTRTVLDWFVLSNPGQLTRVAPDTLHGAWGTPLPPEAQNVELADNRMSQFSPEALVFRGDSAIIFAPLSPGDKELMLQYRIPGTLRQFLVPAERADSVFVMMEERGGRVITGGFAAADSQMLDGRAFARWAGSHPRAGDLEIALPASRVSSRQLLTAMVVTMGAAFALVALVAVRRKRRAPARAPKSDAGFLTDAIARLDGRYLGREAETAAAEWAAYQAERARLLAELQVALATRGNRS
ncbi:MAG TPA: hypothetical protein VFU23_11715 [Gemmatimonadales bacterium]|nr:hypothetical protein [Gemmatimonadales bacterium]